MDERAVSDFIDAIVGDAKLPSARARAELRRELASHFADAGTTPEAIRAAIERFGSPSVVSDQFQRAHRHSRFLTHLLRIAAAGAASTIVALAIQVVANLRVDVQTSLISLAPAFARSASFAAMIVVALVAAWELDIEAFCARLERHPVRFLATIAGFSGSMALFHIVTASQLIAPGTALVASAVDTVIWTCTIAILARTDRAFARVFTPLER